MFGAGAVGCHLAARLAKSGARISVLARGENLAVIRKSGIRFVGPQEQFSVEVIASDQPEELGKQDLVVILSRSAFSFDESMPCDRDSEQARAWKRQLYGEAPRDDSYCAKDRFGATKVSKGLREMLMRRRHLTHPVCSAVAR